jgi:hypothetical protein
MIYSARVNPRGLLRLFRTIACGIALLAAMGMARAQTGLTLRGDSVEGLPGHDVTLTFRADGFWQITEGMGTIQWDPQVMDYVHAGDFGIPEIDEGTFTLIPSGKLSFDWSSDNILGNTLADGSVLFSLTFNVRGSPGEATTVAFTNGWTELHFESAENINLPFSSMPGGVAVVPEPAVTTLLAIGWMMLAVRSRRVAGRWMAAVAGTCQGSRLGLERAR